VRAEADRYGYVHWLGAEEESVRWPGAEEVLVRAGAMALNKRQSGLR